VHPALLTAAGLMPALESLLDAAAVPVRLRVEVDRRAPESVEAAVHALVAEAIDEAAAGEDPLHVDVHLAGATLTVLVAARGSFPSQVSRDRVVAIGGRVTVLGDRVRVELPCG
jgi:hypothetical protein